MCERTTAEYKEELSGTKVLDAVAKKHQVVSHRTDVWEEHLLPEQQERRFRMEQEGPQPSRIKEEDEAPHSLRIKEEDESPLTPHVKEEEEAPQPPPIKDEEEEHSISQEFPVIVVTQLAEHFEGLEEVDVTKMPVTGVPVKSEDDDEHLPEQQKWSFRMATEVPHPSHIKEEDEAPQTLHIKKEEEEHSISQEFPVIVVTQLVEHFEGLEEVDVTKMPVTGVPVTSEDDDEHLPEQQKWSFRMATEVPHPSHIKEEDAALQTLHIKKEEEEHSTVTGVPVKSEDDDEHLPEQQKWSFRMAAEVPHPSHIKEEDAALQTLHIKKEEEEQSPVTGVPVKSEGDGVKSESEGKREAGDEDSKDDKARFKCSHCDKTFRFRCVLTTHVRKHTGERPFVCSVCSGRFSTKSSLETHKTVHTGEKPFICSVCSKGFRLRQDWKTHMKIHTREKVWSCGACSERFFSKFQRKRHKCAGKNILSRAGNVAPILPRPCQPTQGCCSVTGSGVPVPSVPTLYATAGPLMLSVSGVNSYSCR
ncbi:chorion transcription factor Cf2-like isoform X2 [Nerophis ophidion]|uniref:chorion transcription factor Cf2-like isoform X2 n=1 Tax=Nerophis ophidion TaxID=159077 RepID=UPI002ADFDD94|nr:chorion transcription factor Cf2-like isoform X2 [Nerophis ophidion]